MAGRKTWDGRLRANWGGLEWGGTMQNKPIPKEVFYEAPSIDGIKPPAGCPVMQMICCRPQDGHYGGSTGYRAIWREHEPIQLTGAGYDSWLYGCIMLPTAFPNGANMWLAPSEMHQTSPGGSGTGVAQYHAVFNGSSLALDMGGGPTPASGGVGNPGKVRSFTANYPINERMAWHLIATRIKAGYADGAPYGAYETRYALLGRDKELRSLTGLRENIFTMYRGLQNYPLFGVYRQDAGTGDTKIYLAGWGEDVLESDMLAACHEMLGTAAPPPVPPIPPPPPPATYTVDSNVKEGAILHAGQRYTIMVDSTGPISKMRFFFDDVQYDEDAGGPARGGRFVSGLDLVSAKVGPHKFGFASIGPDGKEIPSASFKSYAITVDEMPVPVKSAWEHKEAALAYLARTSETYKVWNARSPARKIGTMWAKALDELAMIEKIEA